MKLPLKTLAAAAVALGLSAGPALAQKTLSFAALPQGAMLNLLSTITSKMLLDKTDIKVSVAPMRGTEAVIRAIDAGRAEFFYSDVTHVSAAIKGEEDFKGRPAKKVLLIAKLNTFPTAFMVRKDSPIQTIADLKGKRIPSGWKAFRQGLVLMRATLATAGMTMKDVRGVPTIGLISAADDFKSGKTDAGYIAPVAPKVREVDASMGGIRFIGVGGNGPEQMKAVRAIREDFHIILVKPAPHLPGVLKPTYMLAFDNALFTGPHVSEAVAYKVTKALMENKATLVKGHPLFRSFIPEQASKQFATVKYHPGAIKYYKEKGLWPK